MFGRAPRNPGVNGVLHSLAMIGLGAAFASLNVLVFDPRTGPESISCCLPPK
jgi:hypothetical protein